MTDVFSDFSNNPLATASVSIQNVPSRAKNIFGTYVYGIVDLLCPPQHATNKCILNYLMDCHPLSMQIAQVHRATLLNGQEVVVKVQHEGIKAIILEVCMLWLYACSDVTVI